MRTTTAILILPSTMAVLALGGADQPMQATESPQRLVEWFHRHRYQVPLSHFSELEVRSELWR